MMGNSTSNSDSDDEREFKNVSVNLERNYLVKIRIVKYIRIYIYTQTLGVWTNDS